MDTLRLGKFCLNIEMGIGQWWEKMHKKVSQLDMSLFLAQLAALYNSGVPILRALNIIASQAHNQSFSEIISEVRREIEKGSPISTSFAKFPGVFDAMEVSIIRMGEVVGDLGIILKKLAAFKRRELDLTRQVTSALTYPAVVFVCSILLIFFLSQFLFDSILPLIRDQGVQLSPATKILIVMNSCAHHPLFLLMAPFLIYGAVRGALFLWNRRDLRLRRDQLLWRMPLVGTLLKKVALARFCANVSFMYENGIGLFKVLSVSAQSSGSAVMEMAIEEAKLFIKEGGSLASSLKKAAIFPPALINMVEVGESSGRIPECLRKLSEFYEMEVRFAVQSLAAALEPLMISVMGFFVGVVILLALSPLYNLIATLDI